MADVPTVDWSETVPDTDEAATDGESRIRELKKQVREVITVDHKMDASGNGDDWGRHEKVTMEEQAVVPTTVATACIFYCKDAGGGIIEIFCKDAAGNDFQVTDGGALKT